MRALVPLLSALLMCGATPLVGAAMAQEPLDPLAVEVEAFQAANQRLQDVGWNLAAGNARFCSDTRFSTGFQLQDMASYGAPAEMRAHLGLAGDFAVLAIAAGSPTSESRLKRNDEVTAINGTRPAEWSVAEKLDWRREKRIHDFIDEALARDSTVSIELADGSAVTLTGRAICSSRFELADQGSRAIADGERVQIGAEFPGLAYPEAEFAAALAHELAHNILKHRKWLDANGRKRKDIRETEREADRLMPWLLANAGYDPAAAVRFMQRWGPGNDGGIFRKRTHDGWDERVELIRLELDAIEKVRAEDGSVDWAVHFRRAIETASAD